MRRFLRIAASTAGVLIPLILAAGGFVYVFAASDYVRARFENHANVLHGRKTKIESIAIKWGWAWHIRLDHVQLPSTDWAKANHMFKADEVETDIRLWPLLRDDLVLLRLVLHKPDIALERHAEGKSNWNPEESPVTGNAAQTVKLEKRAETPLMGRLESNGDRVSYPDHQRQLDLEGTIRTASAARPLCSAIPRSLIPRIWTSPMATPGHGQRQGVGSVKFSGGDTRVAMEDGWVSGLMISLARLQIGDALVLYVAGDNSIPVHCALAHLNFDHGTATFDKTLLDTEKSVLHVKGHADLGAETVDVKVRADPKKFDLLDIHAPHISEWLAFLASANRGVIGYRRVT